jgi:hypothetical protein
VPKKKRAQPTETQKTSGTSEEPPAKRRATAASVPKQARAPAPAPTPKFARIPKIFQLKELDEYEEFDIPDNSSFDGTILSPPPVDISAPQRFQVFKFINPGVSYQARLMYGYHAKVVGASVSIYRKAFADQPDTEVVSFDHVTHDPNV